MYWENKRDELAHAVQTQRFGLVTDVDGTVSPIVDDPDAARVTSDNLNLLKQLQRYLPLVAVISGRAAEDVAHRVDIPGLVYVGNHGMETWMDGKVNVSEKVDPYLESLRLASPEIKAKMVRGMRFEDKGATLSVHYRQTDAPEVVGAELTPTMQAIADRHGLVLTHGRLVFEFRPPINVDKGTAFHELVSAYRLEAAFFIGDDVTDVGAFQAARELRRSGLCQGYGLGVKSQGTPSVVLEEADFFVEEVAGVALFLDWVLRTRMASST